MKPLDASADSSEPSENSSAPWFWLALAVLAVAVAVLYGVAAWPNEFLYDDTEVILAQEAPESVGEIAAYFGERHFPGLAYYRPVTRSTLLVQKALHGEDPRAFHLFNAALAGLAALAAGALLRRPVWGLKPALAWWAAALFALHPVASSCVYPAASGRETLLPAVLMVATLWAFLHRGRGWDLAVVVGLILSLFSKEQAVVLPALFVAAEILGLIRLSWRERAWRYGGMAAGLALYFLLRLQLFGGGELAPVVFQAPLGPVLSFLYSLQTLFLPFVGLAYEPLPAVWWSWPRLLVAVALVTLLVVAVLRLRSRDAAASGTGSVGAVAAFWGLWFVLTQLPTANLILQEAKFSERYVFLANLALLAVVAAVVSRRWPAGLAVRRPAPAAVTVFLGLLLVAAAAISAHRAGYFRDEHAFSRQWVATSPEAPVARLGLANQLAGSDPTRALEHYDRALALNPDYAEAHFNRANLLADLARPEEALAAYREAVGRKPSLVDAWLNLGELERRRGRFELAAAALEGALAAEPKNGTAYLQLAALRAGLGDARGAEAAYRRGLELVPADPLGNLGLGTLLLLTGKAEAAVEPLEAAREARPGWLEALDPLSAAYLAAGRPQDAVATAERGAALARRAGREDVARTFDERARRGRDSLASP